jgi:hypothetical protein
MPISSAATASSSQTVSQRAFAVRGPAMKAAASAVEPINTPPSPGTAVNDPARSMVRRIYRRLSIARS